MREKENDCKIALKSFQTGRVDCQPDSNAERPFFTTRPEIHPNANANGEDTVNYYKVGMSLGRGPARPGLARAL